MNDGACMQVRYEGGENITVPPRGENVTYSKRTFFTPLYLYFHTLGNTLMFHPLGTASRAKAFLIILSTKKV